MLIVDKDPKGVNRSTYNARIAAINGFSIFGKSVTYLLNKPNEGLLIPPGIWAQQTYLTENSVLTVLCDRPYEAADYIREYEEFITYRDNHS